MQYNERAKMDVGYAMQAEGYPCAPERIDERLRRLARRMRDEAARLESLADTAMHLTPEAQAAIFDLLNKNQ